MSARFDQKTILVVEDDEWLRSMLAELLADEGYRVLQASTGLNVINRVEHDKPDALVLDVALPWRSGFDVLHDLRAHEQSQGVPVVLVSGAVQFAPTPQGYQACAALQKPVDFGVLVRALNEALATPKG